MALAELAEVPLHASNVTSPVAKATAVNRKRSPCLFMVTLLPAHIRVDPKPPLAFVVSKALPIFDFAQDDHCAGTLCVAHFRHR